MNYSVTKTENGWEVWDGVAFSDPPIAYTTRREAQIEADRMNAQQTRFPDEMES